MSDSEIAIYDVSAKVSIALNDLVGRVPTTKEAMAVNPKLRAKEIARKACVKAAGVSGGLAIPPGPVGMLTIIPDLIAIWKIQSQMVADIAGAYGKDAFLSPEQMIYCLFKHSSAHAVRDVVVRVGERLLVKHVTLRVMQTTLQKVGVKITQRAIGKALTRYLGPLAALGVAGYAYYDTAQVAETSVAFFESDIGQGATLSRHASR